MHFKQKFYYVYIMSNRCRALYTGITRNLPKRAWQHKTGAYKPDRLVYYERFNRAERFRCPSQRRCAFRPKDGTLIRHSRCAKPSSIN